MNLFMIEVSYSFHWLIVTQELSLQSMLPSSSQRRFHQKELELKVRNQGNKLNRKEGRNIRIWYEFCPPGIHSWASATVFGQQPTWVLMKLIPQILPVPSSQSTRERSLASKTSGGSLNSKMQRSGGGKSGVYFSNSHFKKKKSL